MPAKIGNFVNEYKACASHAIIPMPEDSSASGAASVITSARNLKKNIAPVGCYDCKLAINFTIHPPNCLSCPRPNRYSTISGVSYHVSSFAPTERKGPPLPLQPYWTYLSDNRLAIIETSPKILILPFRKVS